MTVDESAPLRVDEVAVRPQSKLAWAATAMVASLMLVVILLPASLWRPAEVDFQQLGFDSNTMFMDATGDGLATGVIDMTPSHLRMVASPGSAPAVVLLTGPLSYTAQFAVTVTAADQGTHPLTIDLAAPYMDYHFRLVFSAGPDRQVLLQRTHQGEVLTQSVLGVYTVGQTYLVHVALDRQRSSASVTLSTPGAEAMTGGAVLLATTDEPYESHIVTENPLPVNAGGRYTMSAAVKPLSTGSAGMSIEWLDQNQNRISLSSAWAPMTGGIGPWAGRQLDAQAPPGATTARVELATANGGQALFGQVRMTATGESANLLAAVDFDRDASGWRRSAGTTPLTVQTFEQRTFSATVTASDWPELFASLRMSLSVQSQSTSGLASVEISEYQLDLNHQRWLAVKLDDSRVSLISVILAIAGLILVARQLWRRRARLRAWRERTRTVFFGPIRLKVLASAGILLLAFLAGNALLSRVGSLNADIIGARIWTYSGAFHGPGSLYFLPNVSSAEAAQWQGLPLQEAGFPYGPVMAYIFSGLGLFYRFFLNQPVAGPSDLAQIDTLLKATIALFTVADAFVVWLILRRRGLGRAAVIIAVAGIAFNPAFWFAGSVWGTTQAISLLFLLLAIYFAERVELTAAWTLLFAAVLTRPQSIFVAAILGIALLRLYPIKRTLMAIGWAVIITFIYLLPLSLTVSPTLSFDTLFNAFFLHVGSGNDAWTLPASFGAMSLWPMVSQFAGGVHGVDRILYPATTELIGGLSFYQVGTIMTASSVVAMAVITAVWARRLSTAGRLPLVLAATSLGTFLLNTGTPSYHLVLAVALVALTRTALNKWTYYFCLIGLSLTTFLGMYSMGAYWLSNHSSWDVGIYDPASGLTRFMADLPKSDLFVTSLCVVNLAIYLMLLVNIVRPAGPAHQRALVRDDSSEADISNPQVRAIEASRER